MGGLGGLQLVIACLTMFLLVNVHNVGGLWWVVQAQSGKVLHYSSGSSVQVVRGTSFLAPKDPPGSGNCLPPRASQTSQASQGQAASRHHLSLL